MGKLPSLTAREAEGMLLGAGFRHLRSKGGQERFQLMFKKTRELIELLERNGHGRPAQIIKRT